jgi:competence protein ComEC
MPVIALYFAAANDLAAELLFLFAEFSGNPDFSYISVRNFSLYDAVIFYLLLFLLFFTWKKIIRSYVKVIAVFLIAVNFLILSSLDNYSLIKKGRLIIITIDVGQGDAILLKFPEGTTALIDAGDATPSFDNGERIILPLLEHFGINKIDYAFVSHIDADHYAGFVSLVNAGAINKIIKPEIDTSLVKDVKFEKYLKEHGIPVEYYKKEKIIIDDVPVYILNDPDLVNAGELSSNDKSGIMKIVYGRTSFLFTGDIEKKVERIYASKYNSFLDVDFLKAAHHGSKTSSTVEFLNYTTPEMSIISAGILNKFNHPSLEIVRRLESFGSEIYRTDKYGALIFESDGETIKFIDWKK